MEYVFDEPLIRGTIESRPNRFIMHVRIKGKVWKCHCPSTGKIGDVDFSGSNLPCLVSRGKNPDRKTKFTVEAFSLDGGKSWIGINQTRANSYVEFFLRNGMLGKLFGKIKDLHREATLGKSRIDFLVNGKNYLEVKSPLNSLILRGHESSSKLTSMDRLIKHFRDTSKTLRGNSKVIFLLCYMYNAEVFKVPNPEKGLTRITHAARRAALKGVETWQINLGIDEKGVGLIKYFKLKLF